MHGADAVYFRGDVKDGVVSGAVKYGTADEKLSAEMMKQLVSFVTRFNPNYGQVTFLWPMWHPKQSMYLEIGDHMQVRTFRDQKIINLYREDLRQ
jgi:carboxylesterase type B